MLLVVAAGMIQLRLVCNLLDGMVAVEGGMKTKSGELYNDVFGRDPEDRVFCAIPMFHTYGMGACLFWNATSGATMVILEDPNPFLLRRHRAMELIEQERGGGKPQ